MTTPTTWERCPSMRLRTAGDTSGGIYTCCVHVTPVRDGPVGPFKAFGCCWCDRVLPFPMNAVPLLPEPAPSGTQHGPMMQHCRVARPEDLKL